jgi:hypothetical protein
MDAEDWLRTVERELHTTQCNDREKVLYGPRQLTEAAHSTNVLFDTGATHSFVTASWVESHNILVAPMYPPMRVSSIGRRTQTDRFCPSARVQIGG